MIGVSCVLHLGLIVSVLLAEHVGGIATRPPILPIELVTLDAWPVPASPPPPKPKASELVRLPKPVQKPLPQSASEPEPPPPAVAPEPPAATPAAILPEPRPAAPVANEPLLTARPSGGVGPAVSEPPPPSSAPDTPSRAAAPPPSQALAAVPSRDSAPTGAISQYARPQGGYQVRPSYPSTARRLGIQGTSLLKVHVLVDGRVGDVVVQESAGHPDLDLAAADAVRRWRFEPARRGKDPVSMWVLLPVEFRLR